MKVPKIEIEISDDQLSNKNIVTDLNIIPYPCVIYTPDSQSIYINMYAAELLELKENQFQNLNKILSLNPNLQTLFYQPHIAEITVFKKVKIKLINDKYKTINIRAQLLTNEQNKEVYILFLSKTDKDAVNPMFSLYLIKREISDLKPFLNQSGISKLEAIISTYFSEKSKTLVLEDMIAYEDELQIIQKQFPKLSSREILLCVLLFNNLSLSEIATLTNRTLNSISVTIHRINKKLNLNNKNELVAKLQEIVAANQRN